MVVASVKLAFATAVLLLLPVQSQGLEAGRLDGSGAFFYPEFAGAVDVVVARTSDGPIKSSTYLRYLAARFGTAHLEELAFDLALVRECQKRGLARSAPLLARGMAAQRLEASGRGADSDTSGSTRREYAAEALRQLRVDALVQADRAVDDVELRLLFERRYGVGGVRQRVRQVLVSLSATRRRLIAAGGDASPAAVASAARSRALELHGRLAGGGDFAALLAESDDRATRRMLRDPEPAASAGVVSGYDQQRYGAEFARAVQELRPGKVGRPVATAHGYHLIELMSREVTPFADVEQTLRRQLRGGPATPVEVAALRRSLLQKYQFEPVR